MLSRTDAQILAGARGVLMELQTIAEREGRDVANDEPTAYKCGRLTSDCEIAASALARVFIDLEVLFDNQHAADALAGKVNE